MKRKILAKFGIFVLSLSMLNPCISGYAYAENSAVESDLTNKTESEFQKIEKYGQTWYYKANSEGQITHLYVDENSNLNSLINGDTLIIPDALDGKPVVGIGSGNIDKPFLHDNVGSFTKIIMPSTLRVIQPYAFSGMDRKVNINIPAGVIDIGEKSFYNSSITGVDIKGMSGTIGYRAFAACKNLKTISIEANNLTIDKGAFSNASENVSETLLVLSGNIELKEDVFLNNKAVKKLYVPNTVKVGNNAFGGFENLKDLEIGVTTIKDGLFSGCKNLQNVIFDETVTEVGTEWTDNTSDNVSIYVKNPNTKFGIKQNGMMYKSAIGYGGNIDVYGSAGLNYSATLETDKEYFSNLYTIYNKAKEDSDYKDYQGSANRVSIHITDDITTDHISNDIKGKSNSFTGIDAYYDGIVAEGGNVKASNVSVFGKYGSVTGNEYAKDSFYLLSKEDYYALTEITEEAVAGLCNEENTIAIEYGSLNGFPSEEKEYIIIAFVDDNGETVNIQQDNNVYNYAVCSVTVKITESEQKIDVDAHNYYNILNQINGLDNSVADVKSILTVKQVTVNEHNEAMDLIKKNGVNTEKASVSSNGTEQSNSELELEIKKYETENVELQTKTDGLRDVIAEIKDEIARIESNLSSKKEYVQGLENDLKNMTSESEGYAEKVKNHNDAVIEYNNYKNNLDEQTAFLNEKKAELTDIEELISRNNAEIISRQAIILSKNTNVIESLTKTVKDNEVDLERIALQVNSYQSQYDTLKKAIESFSKTFNDENFGYTGYDTETGENLVYIEAIGYPYKLESLKQYPVNNVSMDLYTAHDTNDKAFKFYVGSEGVTVTEAEDGCEVPVGEYKDSLEEMIAKAKDKLLNIEGNLGQSKDILNDIRVKVTSLSQSLSEGGYTNEIEGTESEEYKTLTTEIRKSLQSIVEDYSDVKDDYAAVKAAIFGDIDENELSKKTLSDVINKIEYLKSDASEIEDEIAKAIKIAMGNESEKENLEQLYNDIRTMHTTLSTNADMFETVKTALKVDSSEDFVSTIEGLYRQISDLKVSNVTLSTEKNSLSAENDSLTIDLAESKKEKEDLQKTNETLIKKISELNGNLSAPGQMPTNDYTILPTDSEEVKLLKRQIASLQNRNDALTEKVSIMAGENGKLSTENGSLKKTIKNNKKTISNLETKNTSLTSELQSANSEKQQLTGQVESLSQENEELKESKDESNNNSSSSPTVTPTASPTQSNGHYRVVNGETIYELPDDENLDVIRDADEDEDDENEDENKDDNTSAEKKGNGIVITPVTPSINPQSTQNESLSPTGDDNGQNSDGQGAENVPIFNPQAGEQVEPSQMPEPIVEDEKPNNNGLIIIVVIALALLGAGVYFGKKYLDNNKANTDFDFGVADDDDDDYDEDDELDADGGMDYSDDMNDDKSDESYEDDDEDYEEEDEYEDYSGGDDGFVEREATDFGGDENDEYDEDDDEDYEEE